MNKFMSISYNKDSHLNSLRVLTSSRNTTEATIQGSDRNFKGDN